MAFLVLVSRIIVISKEINFFNEYKFINFYSLKHTLKHTHNPHTHNTHTHTLTLTNMCVDLRPSVCAPCVTFLDTNGYVLDC